MLNQIKKHFMAFVDIFKDKNDYNEKSIVGFLSFAAMVIYAGADIVTGIMGQPLAISDTIFNSFVIITLGSFGIAEAGKIFGNKKEEKTNEEIE
jgi:hypothetical protein